MSAHIQKMTRYFRQSLVDADKSCPEDKVILPFCSGSAPFNLKSDFLTFAHAVWLQGCIPVELAEQIFLARQPKNLPPIQQLDVVFFPRVDLLVHNKGHCEKDKRRVLLPLFIFCILCRDGSLKPGNTAPWVPRVWVAPTQSNTKPFTDMGRLDDFFTQNSYETVGNWQQLTKYCSNLLAQAASHAGQPVEDTQPAQLHEIAISSEYSMSPFCLLGFKTPVMGAKHNVLKVLDCLLNRESYPLLYRAIAVETMWYPTPTNH